MTTAPHGRPPTAPDRRTRIIPNLLCLRLIYKLMARPLVAYSTAQASHARAAAHLNGGPQRKGGPGA
jgi:hypothetical protein